MPKWENTLKNKKMNLKKKLLTLDIIVLLAIAVFSLIINELNLQKEAVKFCIPIMLTVYYIGRYLPLHLIKKELKK